MAKIITEISKYLIIFFMVLYTIKCFTVLKPVKEDKKRRALNVQIVYVFIIHFLCYLTLFLKYRTAEIVIFYLLQMIVSIVYMVSYHGIYKTSSRLITNNMSFLLLIGYVMLTRLDFDLAKKQFIFASLTLVITAFIPLIIVKCKNLKNWDIFYAIAGIGFLGMVFVPFLGVSKYGSTNWISIGPISLQPMEFVKIIFIFFLASAFEKAKGFKDIIKITVVSGIFMLILVAEKDLGGAVIFMMIFIMMSYLATRKTLVLVGGLGGAAVVATLGYMLLKDKFSHVTTRINAWLDPFAYINDDGYQICQSLFAIGSGGLEGRGLGKGLPTAIPVVSSDFIFAAICEELGVIFALCLVLMYISCFIYFINISMKIRNTFYKNVAFGLTICFIFQTFLNIGGVTNFIPSTGVTLPLVSYGVSSVVSTLVLFGIIQGICVLENNGVGGNEKQTVYKQGDNEEVFSGE
jgi:hypothetical protein